MKFTAIVLLICLLCGCSKVGLNTDENVSQPNQSVEQANTEFLNMFIIRENELNPLRISSESGRLIISMVFRPLVTVGQNFDYSCCLAENISLSDDCTKVNVILKKDVLWDDGSAFTSADVDYTVNKIFEYAEESPYFENLSSVTDYYKNGSHGYVFELENSDSGFACLLNFPIVKNGSLSDEILLTGTGDYSITDYKKFSSFVLKAKKPRGKNAADMIKVSLLPDEQSAFSSFKLGRIDAVKLSAEDASTYAIDETKTYFVSNTNRYTFLAVNHGNALLADPALRRIISKIVSTENLITDLMPEFAVHTDSFVNPSAYYAIKNESPASDIKQQLDSIGCIPDESGIRTKEISGNKRRLSFDILVNGDNPSKVIAAEYIANLFGTFGINTTVTELPYNSYIEALSSGVFDLALCETNISLNNDYTFLMGTDGSANFGGYSSENADNLLTEISACSDKTTRVNLLSRLQTLFFSDMPHIPLWFQASKVVYNNSAVKEVVAGGLYDDFSALTSWELK